MTFKKQNRRNFLKQIILVLLLLVSSSYLQRHVYAFDTQVIMTEVQANTDIKQKASADDTMAFRIQNLPKEKNPKFAGNLDESLKVENVVSKKSKGKKVLEISGIASPNKLLGLYIFSEDPIVVSVKSDLNGKWSYELDKLLPDGKHEIFIAVTDSQGNIISKSSPLAFVKTADAATVIPDSRLDELQSPIDVLFRQYVFAALAIAVVSVVVVFMLLKLNPNRK